MPTARPSRLRWTLTAGAAALLSVLWLSRLVDDPSVSLLEDEHGAQWIVLDRPFQLRARVPADAVATFRRRFTVSAPVPNARLVVRAFRRVELALDGRPIFQDAADVTDWKQPRSVELGGTVPPGVHVLSARVVNQSAPAALLVRADALGVRSGPEWEARAGADPWAPVQLAAEPRRPAMSMLFAPAPVALAEKLPVLAAIFAAVFGTSLWLARRDAGALAVSAGAVRWAVLLGWAALGAHNLVRLRHDVGFDAEGHWEYIRWIANGRGVPLATDGWQMFQPPLYYAVSAPFQLLLFRFTDAETAMRLLRIVPFAFGAMQVQLAYLALRYAFRTRVDLQAIGTAFAGILPMNLYLSQSLGNEPMAGCLSGAALVGGLRLLDADAAPGAWALVGLGAILGLALLTKVSAILVVPPLVGAIVYVRRKDARRLRSAARDASIVAATAAVIAGWYYVRNWIRLGRPFIGGWDPSRGIAWWQDPGYRTPAEFVRFGEALVHPIIAGAMSFWDAVYSTFWADSLLSGIASFPSRPPWNYGFLLASAQLALVPTLLLLVGTAAMFVDRRPALVFAGGAIAVQGAALVDAYLRVPYYAIGKAHYTLGVVVCYAILLAAGVERFGDHPVTRALLYGALAAWGFAVCAAYVVV